MVFISSYKRYGLFLQNSRISERNNDSRVWRENLVRGHTRTLIEALEAVEMRGRDVQEHHVSIGRAGEALRNLVGAHRYEDERTMCNRQEVSQHPQ